MREREAYQEVVHSKKKKIRPSKTEMQMRKDKDGQIVKRHGRGGSVRRNTEKHMLGSVRYN